MSPKSQVWDSPTTISSLPRKMNECHLERGTLSTKDLRIIFQASCYSRGIFVWFFGKKTKIYKNLMFHLLSSWGRVNHLNPTNKQSLIPGPSNRSVADRIGSWSRKEVISRGEVFKSWKIFCIPYLDNYL